jgi:hypothetical protein
LWRCGLGAGGQRQDKKGSALLNPDRKPSQNRTLKNGPIRSSFSTPDPKLDEELNTLLG